MKDKTFIKNNINIDITKKSHILFIGAVVFLIIWIYRLIFINRFAVEVPFADQWTGEIYNLYLPYLNGSLSFKDLFALNNEHRIFSLEF